MANQTIGKLEHHCGQSADVRKDKNGRLYLNCPHCGQLKYNLPGGQDYILNNCIMLDERGQLPGFESVKAGGTASVNVTSRARYETETVKVKKTKAEPLTSDEKKPISVEPKQPERGKDGAGFWADIGGLEL